MPIETVNSTNTSHINSNLNIDANMNTMSPEDIMEYVRKALGSLDGQMGDYKTMVEARQKKSEELREALALMREMKKEDGSISGHFDHTKYNRMMTLLAKNSDIPAAQSAYDTFLGSYGGYRADHAYKDMKGDQVSPGHVIGTMAGNHKDDAEDCKLSKEETTGALENARSALESLNSDNEMVMVSLKKLMDQRNQVSQFASNFLNSDNELKKSLIANLR